MADRINEADLARELNPPDDDKKGLKLPGLRFSKKWLILPISLIILIIIAYVLLNYTNLIYLTPFGGSDEYYVTAQAINASECSQATAFIINDAQVRLQNTGCDNITAVNLTINDETKQYILAAALQPNDSLILIEDLSKI
ncbi:hypothetical protein COX58_02305 [archaeon CG_4_10_14_0_2_um_filter_Archaea_38_6]|nr:MAG: hypothetical protein COS83_01590 [archaeon CG07_land_8_20_14_0_80_38_8]PJA22416.1 MAG: hypothetical protein COX58_02305 [archaeon CG_4_10_14_0_2_um_filter_Archaea_38_6]